MTRTKNRWSIAERFDASSSSELETRNNRGEVGEMWRCTSTGALYRIETIGEALRWMSLGWNVYADVAIDDNAGF